MGAVIPLRRELAPVSLATASTLGARVDAQVVRALGLPTRCGSVSEALGWLAGRSGRSRQLGGAR